jgi:hypothetical protein
MYIFSMILISGHSYSGIFLKLAEFCTLFVVVLSKLDEFFSNKVDNHIEGCYEWLSRAFRELKDEGVRFCIEFSNTYPFSNPAPGIVQRNTD